MSHIVIIGNGISGVTCARYVRKQDSEVKITLISAETEHFFARTALMYIYMGHMKYEHTKPYEDHFWPKNRIELIHKYVTTVLPKEKKLTFADNSTLTYDKLVLACGSKSNFFGWEGQDLAGVQGLYNYQDLELMEGNTKGITNAVIVGGGLIGVELAEMLLSRGIKVTFLVREKRFWGNVLSQEEAAMIERHMAEHHIEIRKETELEKITGDPNGKVNAVITKSGDTIPCQFVGIATGVSPNIDFLKDTDIETDKGILINEYFETNQANIYAIGDCAQFKDAPTGRKPLEQIWYTGRIHGQLLAQTLCGKRAIYNPAPWFNSAKFLDIEYQNYGLLPPEPEDNHQKFYWEHSSGKIALRAHFSIDSNKLIGINVFGMRMRHELFDHWLREEASIEEVLTHLKDANFDPELYQKFEEEIIDSYNQQFGKTLKVKKRSWDRILGTMKKLQHAARS